MNDTIYRRDAIQALIDTEEIKGFAYRMLEDRLIGLPSADRPQGWADKAISIIDDMQKEGIIDYEQAWEFRMRVRMKEEDDENVDVL